MTKQITVSVPEDLIAFLDAQVATGAARNRTPAVAGALAQALRRARTIQDNAVIDACDGDPFPDLAGLAERTHIPSDLGDRRVARLGLRCQQSRSENDHVVRLTQPDTCTSRGHGIIIDDEDTPVCGDARPGLTPMGAY